MAVNRAIQALAEQWNRDAEVLRRWGCNSLADLAEQRAADVLAAEQAAGDELLTLQEAARVSGYSVRQLNNLTRSGALVNRGKLGSPLFRRADVPMKPGHAERAENARAVLHSTLKAS